ARSRDRRVYLRSHPMLFALLAATRRRPALRLGGTILIHEQNAYVEALTRIPLNRTAPGTTGEAAGRQTGAGALFDQEDDAPRRGPGRRRPGPAAQAAADRLAALVAPAGGPAAGLATMIAVAAVNTTVAALPRAAAWAADAGLWAYADRQSLADELLRVTAP